MIYERFLSIHRNLRRVVSALGQGALPLDTTEPELVTHSLVALQNRKADKVGADPVEVTDPAAGVILTSPNETRYRVTVSDAGALEVTEIVA